MQLSLQFYFSSSKHIYQTLETVKLVKSETTGGTLTRSFKTGRSTYEGCSQGLEA